MILLPRCVSYIFLNTFVPNGRAAARSSGRCWVVRFVAASDDGGNTNYDKRKVSIYWTGYSFAFDHILCRLDIKFARHLNPEIFTTLRQIFKNGQSITIRQLTKSHKSTIQKKTILVPKTPCTQKKQIIFYQSLSKKVLVSEAATLCVMNHSLPQM